MQKFKFFVFIFFISYFNASAYPIFFKCSANQEISHNFSLQDTENLLAKSGEANRLVGCDTLEECLSQFKQTLILATGSIQAAQRAYLQKEDEILEIPQSDLMLMSNTAKLMTQIRQCHEAQQDHIDSYSLSLYYPHESLYQYITGYKENNPNNYDGFRKPKKYNVYRIIEESIKVGVDPLPIIGMAIMERGGKYVGSYWRNMHDKRSQNVLGCPIGEMKNGLPNVARNNEDIKEIASDLGMSEGSIYTYSCVGRAKDKNYIDDVKGFSNYDSLEEAARGGKTCCIKSKYFLGDQSARKLTTYLYFKQMHHREEGQTMLGSYNPKQIENRLNTFLGVSSTVGTYPSYRISPTRVGVNSYKDPNYGRQIMDYMLNTFMRSGNIMKHIENISRKYNKPVKSFLCVNRRAGSYVIDSDYYFNKIKNSERMLKMKEKYDQGKDWYGQPIKYQSVLLQEFTAKGSGVYKRLPNYLTPEEMKELDKAADHLYKYRNASLRRGKKVSAMTRDQQKIFQKVYDLYFTKPEFYQTRKVLVNAARQDGGISWERSTDAEIENIANETKYQ
jgi:hypothetical protein